MPRQDLFPLRRGTKASWESANPTLAEGEPGFETDTYTLKVGDGNTPYTTLPALNMGIQYYNAQVNGFEISKDNGDVERKFWKDDFSVDSSSQYTGNVADFTWDTANKQLSILSTTSISISTMLLPHQFSDGKINLDIKFDRYTPTGASNQLIGIVFRYQNDNNYYRLSLYSPTSETPNGNIHLQKQLNGRWTSLKNVNISDDLTEFNTLQLVCVGDQIKGYVNDVLRIDVVDSTFSEGLTGIFNVGSSYVKYCKNLVVSPSISYSDDFTSDTVSGANGRYQAVTGTVAYDDVNKRMNVTTATGANGKASGRLKSYKFTEGSQIFDVTLPTGADGDFITLVTHSANGLMTDGIGVGLQSDGAGNWNLATLSGTTVTEGADSGLDDADVARIEIEKDLSGAYWYYIYDAAGAKPATPTGKLFTTLTEGYTGWYANGAGATTQTYAIENISIRAESIVGRTNVEVTEPFWFRDEFREDSRGRFQVWGLLTPYMEYDSTGQFMTVYRAGDSVQGGARSVTKLSTFDVTLTMNSTEDKVVLYLGGLKDIKIGDLKRFAVNSLGIRFSGSSVILQKATTDLTDIHTVNAGTNFRGNTVRVTLTGREFAYYINDLTTPTFTYTLDYDVDPGYVWLSEYTSSWPSPGLEIHDLQISGTRVYNKPIHRGAMLETYHDGTQEVVGTTFVDDCQWDRSAEYTLQNGTATYDAVNGYYTINVASGFYGVQELNGVRVTEGIIGVEINREELIYGGLLVSWDGTLTLDGNNKIPNNALAVYITPALVSVNLFINGALTNSSAGFTSSGWHKLLITIVGTTAKIYVDGVLFKTITNDIISAYDHVGVIGYKASVGAATKWRNLQIIASSPDATNGIAACIPPVGGGARYDTVETIGTTFDNEVQSGRYHAYARYLGTLADGTGAYLESRLENTTDSASIVIGESAVTFPLNIATTMGEYLDEDVWLNYDDVGDEITFNLERASELEHIHPTIFVDSIALIPVSEVR